MSQDEYFSVNYGLTINVEPLNNSETLPTDEQFEKEIPAPFKVASECSSLEHIADNELSRLKNDEMRALVNYLNNQNDKLNLLLSYMLSQQDDEKFRHTTQYFGASNFCFSSPTELAVGTTARVKLFLEHPPAAIYCYTEVKDSKRAGDSYETVMSYLKLREDDRDLLIRAALFQQQKLLRQRAQQRSET